MIDVLENLLPAHNIYMLKYSNEIMLWIDNRSYQIELNTLHVKLTDTWDIRQNDDWDIRQNVDCYYIWSDEKNEYTFEINECDYKQYDIHTKGKFYLYTDRYFIWIAREILKILDKK